MKQGPPIETSYPIHYPCYHPLALQQCEKGMEEIRWRDEGKGEDNVYRYCYHATSWAHSLRIKEGIHRTCGKTGLDFGWEPGFYLFTELENAVEWCIQHAGKWGNECAILVFAIPVDMGPLTLLYLDGEEWMDVVKAAKRGRGSRGSNSEIPHIKGYDLIYGNMICNPQEIVSGQESPRSHVPRPKKQLVAQTDRAAAFLDKCLRSGFYFQKESDDLE
jgi:hypothetical protein